MNGTIFTLTLTLSLQGRGSPEGIISHQGRGDLEARLNGDRHVLLHFLAKRLFIAELFTEQHLAAILSMKSVKVYACPRDGELRIVCCYPDTLIICMLILWYPELLCFVFAIRFSQFAIWLV